MAKAFHTIMKRRNSSRVISLKQFWSDWSFFEGEVVIGRVEGIDLKDVVVRLNSWRLK